jgi:hypothetical protein
VRILYHPEFPKDIRRLKGQYKQISRALGLRFQKEIEEAISRIKAQPERAGQFLNTGSSVIRDVRRRDLHSFPFFILYGLHDDQLIFAAVIPSRSDPLNWLARWT